MTKAEKKKSKDQSAAFVEIARALECDESEERFDEALKKVARHKPPTDRPAPKDKVEKPGK
jgi:hypothetical protein